MAKQTVSVVERHLEKGVLGVAGLAFLAALVLYGIGSPNTIPFEGQPVKPGEIDLRVKEAADNLRSQIIVAQHPAPEIENPTPRLVRLQNVLASGELPTQLRAPTPFGPRVPDLGSRAKGTVELAAIVTPPAPTATVGRSMLALAETTATNWVTVSTMFDRGEQTKRNAEKGYRFTEPPFLGLDVERRQLQPDGEWSEWQPVEKLFGAAELPQPPELSLTDGKMSLPQLEQALAFVKDAIHPYRQLDFMRPLLAAVVAGDVWLYPKYKDVDPVDLDMPFIELGGEPPTGIIKRYPEQTDLAPPTPKKEPSLVEQERLKFEEAKKMFEGGAANIYKLKEARQILFAIKNQLSTLLEEAAKRDKLAKVADDLLSSVEKALAEAERDRARNPGLTLPIAPVQQVWAVDAEPGSVASGQTYQYRVRFRVLNRYAGFPGEMRNPEDAAKVVMTSEPSEPSEPVNVPTEERFFLTFARGAGAKVQVFKWFNGVWLKNDVDVKAGQRVIEEERIDIPGPGNEPVKEFVLFDTGATAVAIDDGLLYHRVRPSRTHDGIAFDPTPQSTVALVYRDAHGELRERLLGVDSNNPERDLLEQKLWDPKKVEAPDTPPPPAPEDRSGGRQPRDGGRRGGGSKGGGGGVEP